MWKYIPRQFSALVRGQPLEMRNPQPTRRLFYSPRTAYEAAQFVWFPQGWSQTRKSALAPLAAHCMRRAQLTVNSRIAAVDAGFRVATSSHRGRILPQTLAAIT